MALAFGGSVVDGRRIKVFTITCLENDIAANLAVDYTTEGMTDLVAAPTEYGWEMITADHDEGVGFAITASGQTGMTIRKLNAGSHATDMVVMCWARVSRGITR